MLTLSESIGRGARAIRVDAGLTLEEVAKSARLFGLAWSTGKVSDLESGRIAATLPTLLAVTAALGFAVGRPVSPGELLAGDGRIAINDQLSIDVSVARSVFSDTGLEVNVMTDVAGVADTALQGVLAGIAIRKNWPVWAREVNPRLVYDVHTAFRESDHRMCRLVGVDDTLGAAAMTRLWSRTFTAERDHRAGPGANPQKRGQVARGLKGQLQKVIDDGDC